MVRLIFRDRGVKGSWMARGVQCSAWRVDVDIKLENQWQQLYHEY